MCVCVYVCDRLKNEAIWEIQINIFSNTIKFLAYFASFQEEKVGL